MWMMPRMTMLGGVGESGGPGVWSESTAVIGNSVVGFPAMDATGQRILLSRSTAGASVSNDFGVSWTATDTASHASSSGAACAADFSLLVISPSAVSNRYIRRSVDGGVTWQTTTRNFSVLPVVSDDGARVLAGSNGGVRPVRSTNGGVSFSLASTGPTDATTSIAGSSTLDVAYITVGAALWKTVNNGVNWTSVASPMSGGIHVACSGDGSVVLCVSSTISGYPRLSTDGGASWSEIDSIGGVLLSRAVAVSKDGNVLVIASATTGMGLCVSKDRGLSWSKRTDLIRTWQRAAISADGERAMVTFSGIVGGAYMYY